MPRIIVCVKQAIDVTQLKADPATRRLITVDAPKKISDFDKNALEEAIRIKEKHGGEVLALTMGTEEAKTALREALAMGADKGYLLTDTAFQNSDTLATSLILTEAIRKLSPYDLILCGETSIDGFTAQVGPRIGERLGIPVITYARKIIFEGDMIKAERSLEDRYETAQTKTPALITVTKEINEPRIPSLMSIMKASKKEIVTWTLADLGLPKEKVGETGSSIQITEVLAPKMERKKIVIKGETPQEIAEKLVKALLQEGVLGKGG